MSALEVESQGWQAGTARMRLILFALLLFALKLPMIVEEKGATTCICEFLL